MLLLGACLSTSGHAAPPATDPQSTTLPTTSTTVPHGHAQHGWGVVSESHGTVLADRRSFHLADGNLVTVFRFRARRVVFALHAGSEDPPGVAARLGPGAGPAISASEAPRLVAAFNGGFKVASGSGGVEIARRVFVPLEPGRASLVIDADGTADVGAWGAGVPRRGTTVESVRQNLQLMVAHGRMSPVIGDVAAWGVTLGGVPQVARSAVGVDAAGDVLYAGSMHALPVDLARALVASGAVRAMELDINPYWVQLASAPHPGAPPVGGIPDQERPGNQYELGWLRDFVTVLVRR